MDDLAAVARQRSVLTTIADVVVSAGAGRSLRIAITCNHRDQWVFADQLTRALHARGRPCRCLRPTPAARVEDQTLTASQQRQENIAVILSQAQGHEEADVRRIDIQLCTGTDHGRPDGPPDRDAQGADMDERTADIIVDYAHTGRPTIEHIAPALTSPPTPGGHSGI